jgi:hypothetical protein
MKQAASRANLQDGVLIDTLLGNVLIFTALYGVVSQKTELFITTAMGDVKYCN